MASIQQQMPANNRTVACYDTMTFLGRKEEQGKIVSGALRDGTLSADKIELTFVGDRDISLMNLQERLSRAPFPVSRPMALQSSAFIRLDPFEAKHELKFDGDRGCRGIALGDLKELRQWDKGYENPHKSLAEVNILEPGKGCEPDEKERLETLVKIYQDYNLWQVITDLVFDDNGHFFIAAAPQPYHPENCISYGKLRQGPEPAKFSKGEVKQFRKWIREQEAEFDHDSEQDTESDSDDGEEDNHDEDDGEEDDGDEEGVDEDDVDQDDFDEDNSAEDDTEQDDEVQ